MVNSTNLDEKKQRPTLWCFAPSLTPESVEAGMSKINCEQLDRAWKAFCGLAEMLDVARHQLNTALENHTSEAQGPLILGDAGSGKSQIIHQLLRQEGAGGVPWTPVIEADVTLMSAERFLDELYFGFWTLFTTPEEDWGESKTSFRRRSNIVPQEKFAEITPNVVRELSVASGRGSSHLATQRAAESLR